MRYDQLKENNPTGGNSETTKNENFATPGHVRNLCFVWPDGRMKFFNYAYLVSGEYSLDESSIILIFTTETIFIKGFALNKLFQDLLNHVAKQIVCDSKRYSAIHNDEGFAIYEITVV
ncbi:MAG TPA: hypothetical protein VHA56_09170 [Mucilaginibacter sp.]|nr:hypothetical protein [Mucilaginibacter sp.]